MSNPNVNFLIVCLKKRKFQTQKSDFFFFLFQRTNQTSLQMILKKLTEEYQRTQVCRNFHMSMMRIGKMLKI